MKKMYLVICCVVVSVLLAACSEKESTKVLYAAREAKEAQNFELALTYYEKLIETYPTSDEGIQASKELIDCKYEYGKYLVSGKETLVEGIEILEGIKEYEDSAKIAKDAKISYAKEYLKSNGAAVMKYNDTEGNFTYTIELDRDDQFAIRGEVHIDDNYNTTWLGASIKVDEEVTINSDLFIEPDSDKSKWKLTKRSNTYWTTLYVTRDLIASYVETASGEIDKTAFNHMSPVESDNYKAAGTEMYDKEKFFWMNQLCVHNGIKTTVNYFNSIGIPLTPTDLGFDSYVIE